MPRIFFEGYFSKSPNSCRVLAWRRKAFQRMSSGFSTQLLAEKLSKLNASQQSIETLSSWCITHRRKAKHIVKTWETEFFGAPKERRVSFLYLANDILQNSRKKGTEFVSEFWKVLNGALKDVKQNGDESGRTAVTRLIAIWEERKVFGSRGKSLRDELLGNNPLPTLEHDKVIKIKRDGGIFERVATAYKAISDYSADEESVMEECIAAKAKLETLEKTAGEGSSVAEEMQQQEKRLSHYVEQLEANKAVRSKLISHLREALLEQEKKIEYITSQQQVAREQAEYAANLRQQLMNSAAPKTTTAVAMPPVNDGNTHPVVSAVEVAAKLAASTSSAAMLSSVISSLAPEEKAAILAFNPDEIAVHTDKRQRTDEITYMVPQLQEQQQQQQQQQVPYMTPYAFQGTVVPPHLPSQMLAHVSIPSQQHPQSAGYHSHSLPPPPGMNYYPPAC